MGGDERRAEVAAYLDRCRAEGKIPPAEDPATVAARIERTRAEHAARLARLARMTRRELHARLHASGIMTAAERYAADAAYGDEIAYPHLSRAD